LTGHGLVERRARWSAATVVLSYMATTGLTSGAGECPHCDCPLLYIHETDTGAWHTVGNLGCAYECVRCGATTVMMDHAPHVYDYLVDADKRARQRKEAKR
jgi:Zn-finger protein